MASSGSTTTLFLLLIFFAAFIAIRPTVAHEEQEFPMKPAMGASGLRSVLIDEPGRRRLSSFQICSLCTCCGGPRGLCLPSPCCYAINCNIPNRPFGFCSFTPKTCNCIGCHV